MDGGGCQLVCTSANLYELMVVDVGLLAKMLHVERAESLPMLKEELEPRKNDLEEPCPVRASWKKHGQKGGQQVKGSCGTT